MVRNDRRTKLLPKIILGQLLFALLITAISLGVIFYAQGMRLDWKNFTIIKTGVLVIDFMPKDANVKLNDKIVETDKGTFVRNLTPKTYFLNVEKDGYQPWSKSLKIESESVNIFNKVVLFKDNIIPRPLEDQEKINLLNSPIEDLASRENNELTFNDYEIWVNNKLATRFSQKISNVLWYSDLYHIVYQQGNEVRVIESDGSSDTLLFKINQTTPARIVVGKRGEEIYFIDQEVYLVANII